MKLVIIPTYNERENIAVLLPAVFAAIPDIHVLIVDDNSPDGTASLVATLAAADFAERLFLLRRPGKSGLGSAYLAGFRWALARPYTHILEMDADLSHNPAYLKPLLARAAECHLVLGSRYVPGGGVRNWSLFRRMLSRGGSLYSRLLLGLPFHDLTGGFKCFRREVLERLNLDTIKSNGYSFQIELTYRAYLLGFTIGEIPIVFEERAQGKSKMSGAIFREALVMIPRLRLSRKALTGLKRPSGLLKSDPAPSERGV